MPTSVDQLSHVGGASVAGDDVAPESSNEKSGTRIGEIPNEEPGELEGHMLNGRSKYDPCDPEESGETLVGELTRPVGLRATSPESGRCRLEARWQDLTTGEARSLARERAYKMGP
jgi:hypothetical protein